MKKKASFVRILGALGVCFGVVAASFSPLLALADPDPAVGYGDIYIGYVEPGVWQVRNSAGVAVKTVTVTTPGPVWFTQNQELPVGTYTIHLLQTGDYVNIDPTPAATVEVIDTDGRVPAGIGQVSDPRWKEVLREYKGLPSLPFFYAVKQNLQYCGSECGVWEALLDLWNEKKAALTPEDLLAVPDFVAYLDLFGSPSTDEERKDMAFFYLTTGWFFGPSGFLGAVLSYGIPAADPILDENPRGAYERYYRYRIVQAGNTVDEELLSWRLDCQFDVCDWDAYGEDDFRALLGDLTPDNYRAMIENRIENADWASVVFLVNDCADTDWYWENPEEYYDVVWGYYGQAQEHVSAFLYATEKDGDGVFSMGDVTTDAERENLFGSLYVGKGNITANKKLVGRPLEGGEFSFGVYRASDIENAGGTTAGLTPLVTATNSAPSSSDGTGAIDLPVSRAKTGRWVHVIGLAFSGDEMAPGSLVQFTGKQDGSDVWAGEEFSGLAVGEIDAGNARINYDTNIVPVADFDVTPYGQTPISTVHLEQTGGGATFSNSVRSAEMTVAHVKKVLHGRTLANEEFTFQLCEDAQCNTVLETKKNDSSGTVPFEGLTFDVAGLADGTYTWYVREVMPASPENGMTYDTHVQPVAITVQGGGLVDVSCGADTTCSADPNAPEIKTYTFTNEYFNPYTTGLASQSIALYAMLAIAVFAGGVAVVYARFAKGKIFAARDV